MTAIQQLNARIASYRDLEARALIHFLIQGEVWAVSNRLNMTTEEAKENVAARALDFLASIEGKL